MECPACKGAMAIVEYDRIEVDYCTRCYGVWFDAGELELLLERDSLERDGQGLDEVAHDSGEVEKGRRCPLCRENMHKARIGPAQQVLIDVCPRKEGLWFDGGELDQLIEHLEQSGAPPTGNQEKVGAFLREAFKARHQATSHPGGTA